MVHILQVCAMGSTRLSKHQKKSNLLISSFIYIVIVPISAKYQNAFSKSHFWYVPVPVNQITALRTSIHICRAQMNTNSHTKMSATNIADNEEQLIILPSPPTGYLNFSIDGECRQCGEGESTSILKRILQTEYSNMPLDKRADVHKIYNPIKPNGFDKAVSISWQLFITAQGHTSSSSSSSSLFFCFGGNIHTKTKMLLIYLFT